MQLTCSEFLPETIYIYDNNFKNSLNDLKCKENVFLSGSFFLLAVNIKSQARDVMCQDEKGQTYGGERGKLVWAVAWRLRDPKWPFHLLEPQLLQW